MNLRIVYLIFFSESSLASVINFDADLYFQLFARVKLFTKVMDKDTILIS